jgi:iron complex outermembrane receptor protein
MKSRFLSGIGIGAVLATIPAQAAAQETATVAPPAASGDRLDEIVVTAQKRDQNLQDVGVSIAAFTGDQLKDLGVTSAERISESVPGVQVYSYLGRQPTFVIRGIGVQDFAPNVAPAAAVYLDEVYLGSNILTGFQIFDTDRVEILKGPQGTLFGRNTTGGAVSYSTRRPTDTLEGYAEGTYGNYRAFSLDAAVSGPLTPTLKARLAGRYASQARGYYTNDWTPADTALPRSPLLFNPRRRAGEQESWAARGLLEYGGGGAVKLLLNLHGGETTGDVLPLTSIGFTSIAGAAQPCAATPLTGVRDPRFCGDTFGYTDLDGDPYRVRVDFVGRNREHNLGASLRGEFDLGSATLTSITSYDDARKRAFTDTDGAPHHELNQLRDTRLEQYSQELRLASDGGGPLYWIAGLYGAREKVDLRFFGTLSPLLGLTNFTDPALAGRVADQLELNFSQDTLSAAAYGHAEWKATDRLTLVAGLRYSHEDKDFESRSEWIYSDGLAPSRAPVNFGSTPADAAVVDDSATYKSFSGKIGLNYKPSDAVLLYGSISRGFKSGGFDGDFAFTRQQLEPFEEEVLTAYEIGVKSTLIDRRLFLNGSLYHYDFDKPQVRVAQVDTVTGLPFNQLRNLAKARVTGMEIDATLRPARGFDLRAGLAWIDTRIDDPAQPVFDGNDLPLAAKFSANLLARYQFAVGGGWDMALQVDGKYNDAFFLNAENTPYLKERPYTLVNARVSLLSSDSGGDLALWGRNLTKESFAVQSFALFGAYSVAYNAPRTYGATIRIDW